MKYWHIAYVIARYKVKQLGHLDDVTSIKWASRHGRVSSCRAWRQIKILQVRHVDTFGLQRCSDFDDSSCQTIDRSWESGCFGGSNKCSDRVELVVGEFES